MDRCTSENDGLHMKGEGDVRKHQALSHAQRVDERARESGRRGFRRGDLRQAGFVSYEFVDCGYGEVMTISIFGEARGAAGSRDLARRWIEENLQDLEFTRVWALDGEILVSRAKEEMLEPWHVGTSRKFASVRHYALRGGSVAALMHKVDEIFADRIERLDGFDAYNAPPIGRFGSENRAVLRARSREGSPNRRS